MKNLTHLPRTSLAFVLLLALIVIVDLSQSIHATEKNNFDRPPTAQLSDELTDLLSKNSTTSEKLDLDLFVMSYCPYGIDAELVILPYVKEHQDQINLNIYYIANEMTDGSFASMHGEKEVEEDLRQLIIKRLYPDKYLDYILTRGKDIYSDNLKEISNDLGIDMDKVNALIGEDESAELLRNNILISGIKEINASPTLLVEGEDYEGRIVNFNEYINRNSGDKCTIGDSSCVAVQPREIVWFLGGKIVPRGTLGALKWIRGSIHVCQYVNGYPEWVDSGTPCPIPITSTECKLGDTKCKIVHPVRSFYKEENGLCVKYRKRVIFECKSILVGNHIRRLKRDWVETDQDCSRKIDSQAFDESCARCDENNGVVSIIPEDIEECKVCNNEAVLVDAPDGSDCICPICECPGICKGGVCVHEDGHMFDGDPCDDHDPTTCNDHYENCECVGETDPGECKKCENGEVVADDDFDPGICKKCKNGEVVADDDFDPGICWKCKDKEKIIDDSENPGICEKCENGNIVDDPDDPSPPCSDWLECLPENFDDPDICQECIDYSIQNKDNGSSCDDGDPCTKNDHCVDGQCVGDPVTSKENPDCGGK